MYNKIQMTTHQEDKIRERLATVTGRIEESARKVGRDPQKIRLVAVTKTWPADMVIAAYKMGIRHVGENRAEELSAKRKEVAAKLPEVDDLVWHQIGTLQSRKTKIVAQYADSFHALDRIKIARRLSNQLAEIGRILPVFLEVNLSGEGSKSGFLLNNWEENATQRETVRNVIESIAQLPCLDMQGLMTMAPWGVHEDMVRSVFRRTNNLAEWLQEQLPGIPLQELSMGMSDDYWIAVEEGATIVRIGRAIFGSRT